MAGGLLAKGCGVRSEGLILGPKAQDQKISVSSPALGMTVWGFFYHPGCFPKSSPMIRIK
jgi:hypothetical protein